MTRGSTIFLGNDISLAVTGNWSARRHDSKVTWLTLFFKKRKGMKTCMKMRKIEGF